MAVKVTVDLANKRLVVKAGVTSLDSEVDLYSDLKEDWIANANGELGFEFPFRTIGGDPIGGGLEAGAFFFLRNDLGWRLRPDEANHELLVAGNLYGESATLPLFVPTLNGSTVAIELERSSLTQEKQVGSGVTQQDKQDIAGLVGNELQPVLATILQAARAGL